MDVVHAELLDQPPVHDYDYFVMTYGNNSYTQVSEIIIHFMRKKKSIDFESSLV